jgi:hypothetical protein
MELGPPAIWPNVRATQPFRPSVPPGRFVSEAAVAAAEAVLEALLQFPCGPSTDHAPARRVRLTARRHDALDGDLLFGIEVHVQISGTSARGELLQVGPRIRLAFDGYGLFLRQSRADKVLGRASRKLRRVVPHHG